MIIAVDAEGGDYAPHEVVKGAIKAAQEHEVEIALVGRRDILHVLAGKHLDKLGMTIVDANEVIGFHEHAVEAVTCKPQSSIVIGTNLVKEGSAAAFISAGNTGAVFYAAISILGRLNGIERPAIGTLLGLSSNGQTLFIDSGANTDCRPIHLVHFARLGNVYAREILGIASPRIGLLNNGAEPGKGNRLARESYDLLKQTDLNFIGNVEGHDFVRDRADVIVTDGFTGNIILKTIEGLGDNWLNSLTQVGQVFSKAYRLSRQALHRDMGIDSWAKKLDYKESGGATLLGVNGNIIIAHGRSQAKAIMNAIGMAKRTAEKELCQKIKEEQYEQANGDK
ncbi:MAG: phosphate acyltransferase PlsX [Chloroflexi bacterium]|nr:phosphate acyltransferase PlsX [Chloroflexota bacterium]